MTDHQGFEPRNLDPALLRGLAEPRISRQQLVRRAGTGALAFGLAGFLEACGVGGANKKASTGTGANAVGSAEWWAKQKPTGTFQFANWPYYIDTSHGKHPSLQQFTKATGIKVNYEEVIQNNDSFYAKIAPSLQGGQGTGYDMIVMTNGWYLTELINHQWLIPLDHSKLPNFSKHASPLVKDPAYDPANKYTLAWQSGFTGIGYNPKLTGREITSIGDLWDPRFAGHVGMMSDNTELGSVALLKLGIKPTSSTKDDWNKAAKVLKQQRHMVRQYYDQSYIHALETGDVWITQAWSGDIFQANENGYKDLKFVVPKEGVMHWTDNMAIPLHAPHPADALAWMNFYYQPKIAAEVADWVAYVCPVPSARPYIAKQLDDPTTANSPLVFPTKAMTAKAHDYYTFKNFDEFNTWNNIFNPIIQS